MAQAQAGFQQAIDTTIDIPLIGMPLQRGTGTGDQRYVNVLFESIVNPVTQGITRYVLKRPGLLNFSQPPLAAATGRGLYYWSVSDKIYSIFDNKIWSNTTDLGITLGGSSGRVWFDKTAPTSAVQRLCISDGTKLYLVNSADGVTTVDTVSDPQFPTANLGPVIFFNDYLYFAKSNGEIWNSESDAPTLYLGTALISAAMYGDDLEGIARQKDMLLALGKQTIEFYFDNKTTPSPLLRQEQNAVRVGLAHRSSLASSGDLIVWVSESEGMGRGVWQLDGLTKLKYVSTPTIDRFLNAEGTSISSITAWMDKVAGHLIYVMNLSSANRTFVYDVEEQLWFEWEIAAGSAKFNGIASTTKDGIVYVQDATNGRIYQLLPTTFQDSAANFTVTIQTDNYDFGTPFNKFQEGLWIIGDNTTGNLNVSESDDDYVTFNAARTIDLSKTRKFLGQGGSFFQRAYRMTYADNYALRMQKMSLKLKVGNV